MLKTLSGVTCEWCLSQRLAQGPQLRGCSGDELLITFGIFNWLGVRTPYLPIQKHYRSWC